MNIIWDRNWVRVTGLKLSNSCLDLESITKWILKYFRHKAVIVFNWEDILGHVKMKWYRTFLSYWDSHWLSRGGVYRVQRSLSSYLQDTKSDILFWDDKLCTLNISDVPFHVTEERTINEHAYSDVNLLYWWNDQEELLDTGANFREDLSDFLWKINELELTEWWIPKNIFESRRLTRRIMNSPMRF